MGQHGDSTVITDAVTNKHANVTEFGELKVVNISGDTYVRLTGYNGVNYRDASIDLTTRSMQSIDYAHHEVHSGSHFMYTDSQEIASGASGDYIITTPNTTKWAHMLISIDGSAITQYKFYEGTNKNGATAQTAYNNNRNSSTVPTVTIHKGTSGGSDDGAVLFQYKGGAATQTARSSSEVGNSEEIILKQNTKYIMRAYSFTNSNLVNFKLEWYEHTNKDA